MKGRKGLLVVLLCCLVIIICAIGRIGFSEETKISHPTEYFKGTHLSHYSVEMDVEAMNQFIVEKTSTYEQAKEEGLLKEVSYDTKQDMLEAALFANEAEAKEQLKSCGIYECDLKTFDTSNGVVTSVDLVKPKLYYNAQNGNWIITCGGYYTSEDYKKQFFPGDVGGRDHFGFHFSDTVGEYTSHITDIYGVIQDEDGNVRHDTTSRSSMDGSLGVDFELQDYTYLDKHLKVQYVGARWYAACSYASGFENYGGILTTFYNHTD